MQGEFALHAQGKARQGKARQGKARQGKATIASAASTCRGLARR
jgi:hypothetical protein